MFYIKWIEKDSIKEIAISLNNVLISEVLKY